MIQFWVSVTPVLSVVTWICNNVKLPIAVDNYVTVIDSPYRCIVLPPDFCLAGHAVVVAPFGIASIGWKAVHLECVLAFEACLGAGPSITPL